MDGPSGFSAGPDTSPFFFEGLFFMGDFYLLERFNFQIIQRKISEKNMIRLRIDRNKATGVTRK